MKQTLIMLSMFLVFASCKKKKMPGEVKGHIYRRDLLVSASRDFAYMNFYSPDTVELYIANRENDIKRNFDTVKYKLLNENEVWFSDFGKITIFIASTDFNLLVKKDDSFVTYVKYK